MICEAVLATRYVPSERTTDLRLLRRMGEDCPQTGLVVYGPPKVNASSAARENLTNFNRPSGKQCPPFTYAACTSANKGASDAPRDISNGFSVLTSLVGAFLAGDIHSCQGGGPL